MAAETSKNLIWYAALAGIIAALTGIIVLALGQFFPWGGELSLVDMDQNWGLVFVTDLDFLSRQDKAKTQWVSFLQKAQVEWDKDKEEVVVHWLERTKLVSKMAYGDRSMELSALAYAQGQLFGFCDRSGIVYSINTTTGILEIRAHLALKDTPSLKAFKAEWAVVSKVDGVDASIIVGSSGKEWTEGGKIAHERLKWVKRLTLYPTNPKGGFSVEDINWKANYDAMRKATDTLYPGYLLHEAAAIEPATKEWVFVPRKVSHSTPYNPDLDEMMSGNTVVVASNDFATVRTNTIGPLELEWGFTDLVSVPTVLQAKLHKDGMPAAGPLFVGVKSKEIKGEIASKLCIFDLKGNFYTNPKFLPFPVAEQPQMLKYEGASFVNFNDS